MSRYTEPLNLLIAVPADHTQPTFVGHWAPPGTTAQFFHIYAQLSAAQIELLQDHKRYGTLNLPCLESDFASFLHRQIVHLHTHSADPHMVSKLSASITGEQTENATQVQLFGVKVLRESDDGWLLPDRRLMWKWVKPRSAYRKSGAWEATLEKAVVDGEWSAGKEIVILVKSAQDENL